MATQLFGWDCESGAMTDYFNENVHAASVLSTTRSHSGTTSIQFDPSRNTNGDCVVQAPYSFGSGANFVAWSGHKTQIFLRWWMYVETTISAGAAGTHGWRIKDLAGTPDGAHPSIMIDSSSGSITGLPGINWGFSILDYADTPVVDSAHDNKWVYPLGVWFKFEFHIVKGSQGGSDGSATAWINGAQVYNETGLSIQGVNNATTGWDSLALNTNYDAGGSNSVWYIDDIEIWDGVPASDTTNPTITITGPTSSATYATGTSPLTISGTASDDTAVTSVTWSNDRGGSGTATGTTSWSFSATLATGVNVITVTAHDAAANAGTDIITVTYSPDTRTLSLRPATMM